jgi:UPF0271 protein
MSSTFKKPLNTFARDLMVDGLSTHMDVNLAVTLSDKGISDELTPLLPYVSSISIPCGVHAGHPLAIKNAVAYAKANQLAIGAEVALPPNVDEMSDDAWQAWVLVQLGALRAMAHAAGGELQFVRPDAVLYDEYFAKHQPRLLGVAKAMASLNQWLMLVGPFGPVLDELAEQTAVRTVGEVHIGKRYKDNGIPLLNDAERFLHGKAMVEQLHQLIKSGTLTTQSGKTITPNAPSIHIDPNIANAEQTLKNIHERLQHAVPMPIAVAAPSGWV